MSLELSKYFYSAHSFLTSLIIRSKINVLVLSHNWLDMEAVPWQH